MGGGKIIMALEKKSWNLLFLFLIIAGAIFSLRALAKGYDYTDYIMPIFMFLIAMVLLVEVHAGYTLNIHTMRSLGATQWMTTIIASIAMIDSILILPFININIMLLNQLSGWIMAFMTLFVGIEWYSQH